jgi:hypothetical protein
MEMEMNEYSREIRHSTFETRMVCKRVGGMRWDPEGGMREGDGMIRRNKILTYTYTYT